MKKKILFTLLLVLFSTAVLALDFTVTCPAAQANVDFNCQVALAQVPAQGLNGLSFTVNANGAQVKEVTFVAGLNSVSSGNVYGFFSLTPYAAVAPFATVKLNAANNFNLQIVPRVATLGDNTRVVANQLIFPQTAINLVQGCVPACQPVSAACPDGVTVSCNSACTNGACVPCTPDCSAHSIPSKKQQLKTAIDDLEVPEEKGIGFLAFLSNLAQAIKSIWG